MQSEHIDVLIVGAGLSGIDAAYHLQTRCPERSFVILEGRETMGGTWDLFRYPGVRSDSDMFTLGYSFRPWKGSQAIAEGPAILAYLQDTAREYGIDQKIRYRHRVKRASWSSAEALWTVEVERAGEKDLLRFTCNFFFSCCGYYRYDEGHAPSFPGAERFTGRVVHPQHWPQDLDYAGKRVVVIGSGATAMTVVPAMAREAAHVTLLQRSPTYVVSRPSEDPHYGKLSRWLPAHLAYLITRWKRVLLGMYVYSLSRREPDKLKALILKGVRMQIPGIDVETHFTPRYNPWDQRMCLLPDGDLFKSIRSGRVAVETDHIETFTEKGIRLRSGRELDADLIVSATGIELLHLGGIGFTVDGNPVDFSKTMGYKGMMFRDVPNLASVSGYLNASWTLKADLVCAYVCRLLNHMDKHGLRQCTPRLRDPTVTEQPWMTFSSGYVQRAVARFPKQGSKAPWRLYQNYIRDLFSLKFGRVNDRVMEFTAPLPAPREAAHALQAKRG